MAGISEYGNGLVIQFRHRGKKFSIRLKAASREMAAAVAKHVDSLICAAKAATPPSAETTIWLSKIDEPVRRVLISAGLVTNTDRPNTIAELVDYQIARRTDLRDSTLLTWRACRQYLISFFREQRIEAITPGDVEEFRVWLASTDLAQATASKRTKQARQFFQFAVKKKWIESNPFADVRCPTEVNSARAFFVTREVSDQIVEQLPTNEWRLIFALARYGGLRVPSEIERLTWDHVHWDDGILLVESPKTERHSGHATRKVPIFPELRHYLAEARKACPPDGKWVCNFRKTGSAYRVHLLKAIHKAGLTPWPRLWQNLRASRETELVEQFPIHVACAWIGNSPQIAAKHYLQVTDEHFKRATET